MTSAVHDGADQQSIGEPPGAWTGPLLIGTEAAPATAAVLVAEPDGLPRLVWTGPATPGLDAGQLVAAREHGTAPPGNQGGERLSVPLLPEVSRLWFGRPG